MTDATQSQLIARIDELDAEVKLLHDLLLKTMETLAAMAESSDSSVERLNKIDARLLIAEVQIKARTKPAEARH